MTGRRMGHVKMIAAGVTAGAILAGLLTPPALTAQSATVTPDPLEAEAGAVATIAALFDAMRTSDAEAMRGLFADDVAGFPTSYVDQENDPAIRFGELDSFLESVGGAEPGSLDEQFVVRDVIIDDNLVTVVTPYTFTYQGNLSHCGVNVFLVARQGGDWKIAGLADTRRRGGCDGWLEREGVRE